MLALPRVVGHVLVGFHGGRLHVCAVLAARRQQAAGGLWDGTVAAVTNPHTRFSVSSVRWTSNRVFTQTPLVGCKMRQRELEQQQMGVFRSAKYINHEICREQLKMSETEVPVASVFEGRQCLTLYLNKLTGRIKKLNEPHVVRYGTLHNLVSYSSWTRVAAHLMCFSSSRTASSFSSSCFFREAISFCFSCSSFCSR